MTTLSTSAGSLPNSSMSLARARPRSLWPKTTSVCLWRIESFGHEGLSKPREKSCSCVDGRQPRFYTPRVNTTVDLLAALRRYWGYDAFRPLQEKFVHILPDAPDTSVVIPPGGGKWLCSHFPAAKPPANTLFFIPPFIPFISDQLAHL